MVSRLVLLVMLALFPCSLFAQTNTTLQYQGSLFDSQGAPVTTNKTITFRLFNDAEAGESGDALWTETLAVDIAEGFFTVPLGSVNAFDESVFKETELWLELEIDSETLSPRQPVAAVPWARRAFSVEGKVEATSITSEGSVTVGGSEVINASGQWVGSISIESNEFNCSGCVEATALSQDYYTSSELDEGALDNRYHLRTEIENLPPKLPPGKTYNLAWLTSSGSGEVKISSLNGNELSVENPGYINVPSALQKGHSVILKITSDTSICDADCSQSNLSGWTFGVTGNVAWNTYLPVWIVALNLDDTDEGLAFGFTRTLSREAPDASLIGDIDSSLEGSQQSLYIMKTGDTSIYEAKPMILIGATSIQKPDENKDWVFINNEWGNPPISEAGIEWIEQIYWLFPVGQNGAQAGHFTGAGGPTWEFPENYILKYTIKRTGEVRYWGATENAGACSNGTDNNGMRIILPIAEYNHSYDGGLGLVGPVCASKIGNSTRLIGTAYNGSNHWIGLYKTDDSIGVENDDLIESEDDLYWSITYDAF